MTHVETLTAYLEIIEDTPDVLMAQEVKLIYVRALKDVLNALRPLNDTEVSQDLSFEYLALIFAYQLKILETCEIKSQTPEAKQIFLDRRQEIERSKSLMTTTRCTQIFIYAKRTFAVKDEASKESVSIEQTKAKAHQLFEKGLENAKRILKPVTTAAAAALSEAASTLSKPEEASSVSPWGEELKATSTEPTKWVLRKKKGRSIQTIPFLKESEQLESQPIESISSSTSEKAPEESNRLQSPKELLSQFTKEVDGRTKELDEKWSGFIAELSAPVEAVVDEIKNAGTEIKTHIEEAKDKIERATADKKQSARQDSINKNKDLLSISYQALVVLVEALNKTDYPKSEVNAKMASLVQDYRKLTAPLEGAVDLEEAGYTELLKQFLAMDERISGMKGEVLALIKVAKAERQATIGTYMASVTASYEELLTLYKSLSPLYLNEIIQGNMLNLRTDYEKLKSSLEDTPNAEIPSKTQVLDGRILSMKSDIETTIPSINRPYLEKIAQRNAQLEVLKQFINAKALGNLPEMRSGLVPIPGCDEKTILSIAKIEHELEKLENIIEQKYTLAKKYLERRDSDVIKRLGEKFIEIDGAMASCKSDKRLIILQQLKEDLNRYQTLYLESLNYTTSDLVNDLNKAIEDTQRALDEHSHNMTNVLEETGFKAQTEEVKTDEQAPDQIPSSISGSQSSQGFFSTIEGSGAEVTGSIELFIDLFIALSIDFWERFIEWYCECMAEISAGFASFQDSSQRFFSAVERNVTEVSDTIKAGWDGLPSQVAALAETIEELDESFQEVPKLA